jgi:hypothetical protein
MRLLNILSLLVAFGCSAQDTNDITRKAFERDRDKDGKPDFRVESVFRGKERVMVVWSKPNAKGVWSATSRAYYAGGDMVAVESDEDGDGFFETLATYRSGTEDMEVFTRQRDGTVQPVSAQTLAAFKKQNAAISEFWDKTFSKDADPDKLEDSIRETQKKVRDAEREKRDDKK